jgi:small-conductance mechanosensitive channel/CRP-like cAMP-binding protein
MVSVFRQAIQQASLDPGAVYLTLGVFLGALLLLRLAPKTEKQKILLFTGLFGLCIAGLFLAAAIAAAALPRPAGYVRQFCILGEGLCIIGLAGVALFRWALPVARLPLPRIVQDVAVAITSSIWILLWLSANNVNLTGIIATSAVMTAVIGFSLQDTFGNILGGMAIHLDQSIRVGDWIQIDDVKGRVVESRWRHTALETTEWETVVIPNSVLLKNKFRVLGRRQGQPNQVRRWVWFRVDFPYPPAQVIETVEQAIRSAEILHVARRPGPECVLAEFTDSEARYGVCYYLTNFDAWDQADSEVRVRVYYALKRAGIPLATPSQSIFLTHETDEREALRAEQMREHGLQALGQVDLFRRLQPDELQQLAGRLAHTPFVAGDIMTRQGAKADWLYLIIEGQADVIVENGQGHSTRLAQLGPGSFFGEMGLMTGEPRTATVVARTEMDCYRLDKEAFQQILRSRPAIAEEISAILAARRLELDAALESLDAAARSQRLSETRRDVLDRIRRFFGLDDSSC